MEKNYIEISYLNEKAGIYYLGDKLFTGIRVTYFDTGEIETTAEYFEGKKNGISKKFNTNGSVYWKTEYKNNMKHGNSIVFADEKEMIPSFLGTYKNGSIISKIFPIELTKVEYEMIEKLKGVVSKLKKQGFDE